jgi:hypothetical protein
VFTLSKSLDYECKVDKSEKDNVEFLEAGKNAPEAFQTTKEPLHFIPFLVQFTIIFPRVQPVSRWPLPFFESSEVLKDYDSQNFWTLCTDHRIRK